MLLVQNSSDTEHSYIFRCLSFSSLGQLQFIPQKYSTYEYVCVHLTPYPFVQAQIEEHYTYHYQLVYLILHKLGINI